MSWLSAKDSLWKTNSYCQVFNTENLRYCYWWLAGLELNVLEVLYALDRWGLKISNSQIASLRISIMQYSASLVSVAEGLCTEGKGCAQIWALVKWKSKETLAQRKGKIGPYIYHMQGSCSKNMDSNLHHNPVAFALPFLFKWHRGWTLSHFI